MENLLKMTKRELFEKIVKEINSKEHELEQWKTSMFSRLKYDIKEILNVEDVVVWKECIPDNYKAQVFEINFKKKDFILKLPILITCKKERVAGMYGGILNKVMLKKIELNMEEIECDSLDKTIGELIEENFALTNKKNNDFIVDFEKRLEQLPNIVNEMIEVMKKKEDISCNCRYEIERLIKDYSKYQNLLKK